MSEVRWLGNQKKAHIHGDGTRIIQLGLLDVRYASVEELATGLRARRFTAVELAEAALASLGAVGPKLNAIANLTAERALAEAARADRRLARGGPTSPLVGIPYGVKDLLAARGAPTTWGAPEFRDQVFDEDATAIDRLRRRGAVLAAKLALAELAGAGRPRYPGASLHGQGRNPWDPRRYSGGSSSGPGIAVAAGLVPFALGSETGGSIHGPCAYSGVTGIRPTYGLVPRTGAMPLAWTLDKIGVLARSARDCAIALAAVAGPDGRDVTAAGRFRPLDARSARAALRSVRVGFAGDDLDGCTDAARPALEKGIQEFRRIAGRFVRFAMRADLPYAETIELVMLAEAATVFSAQLDAPRFDLVDRKQLAELREGQHIRARDYLQAMRVRTLVAAELRRVFKSADVILSVGRTDTAQLLDEPRHARTANTTPDRLRAAGNLAGLPGVFFPCGLAGDGLPVGLQLVGPPRTEPLLIALAEAYQRETAHHLARPTHA